MTYEEAILEKQEAEKTIMNTGLNYVYLIVPMLETDRLNFLQDYDEKAYSDEDCKKYSTNNEYTVWQQIDDSSANILFRK